MIKKLLALTMATMMILTGCSTNSNGDSNQSQLSNNNVGNPPVEETVKPTEKDEEKIVRINISSEPDSLNPWQSAATDTSAIFQNVFEGLISYNEDGELLPGLAKEWHISDDGLTYTFTLRDDVYFHNGKKMTVEDIVYTYENLSGLNGEKAISSKFSTITNIATPDENTVVITLSSVNASFLAFNIVSVLPKGYADQANFPIGTGPFKFVEYVPGQKVVLEKNEDYYETSKLPQIDKAEIYIMSDESAVIAALRSGQLNIASVSAENADLLKSDFDIIKSPQNMVQVMALNNSIEPFNNLKVRQAINYAVDKQEIINGVFGGFATELYTNFSPVMSYYYNDQLSNYYNNDIEKAKQLMSEAGYENGFDTVIKVPANYQKHVDTAQVIVQQLKQININASIEPIEWGEWLEDVYTSAKYEITIIGLTGKLDPNDILARYSSTYAKNFFKYSDEKFDNLIIEAVRETDEANRAKLYKECQKNLTENAAAVYICDPNSTVVSSKNLKGYTFYPVGYINLSKLHFEN